MIKLTEKELRLMFNYDPDTGFFTRLIPIGKKYKAGTTAGYKNPNGYIEIKIDGKVYKAHRLAFLYMTGSIPYEVDHVDHIPSNNKFSNLRNVTHITNQRNMSQFKNNTSGLTGIYWSKKYQKWEARITINYKQKFIGYFEYWFDAVCARKSSESLHGFHANHGHFPKTS